LDGQLGGWEEGARCQKKSGAVNQRGTGNFFVKGTVMKSGAYGYILRGTERQDRSENLRKSMRKDHIVLKGWNDLFL